MALTLQLDHEHNRPLYQQIAEQIKTRVSDGRLPAGTRLPPVRQLAQTLGVTRLTVHNAYSELQSGGWVEATVGRGTYVSAIRQNRPLSSAIGRSITTDGVLDDILHLSRVEGIRSMAYADPDPSTCPATAIMEAMTTSREDFVSLLQYGPPQGDPQLRVELSLRLHERAIEAAPDEIIVTAGVTQALALLTQALTRPGDTVLIEQPSYLGALHVLRSHGTQPVGVPMDEGGPHLDELERLIIEHRPRFYYTIPTYHNPTGTCVSVERRRELLALAHRHNVLLVEDDIYSGLDYDSPAPLSLKALDRQGVVVYVDGFSKVLAPGLRVGYMVAPPPLHDQLLTLRRAADLCGPMFTHRGLAIFMREGKLKSHLRRVAPLYRERRDILLGALKRSMPDSVRWSHPAGGFCCWVTLPRHHGLADLYQAALAQGIVFTPGEVFLAQPSMESHLRLCFGSQPPEVIREGVAVLGRLISQRLEGRSFRAAPVPDCAPLV